MDSMTSPSVKFERRRIFVQNPSHQPVEGFVLEIDGKLESEYGTFTSALKAALKLRQKYPQGQVKVHDANEQTPVELTELSDKKTITAS
jgi:hypothetical protein